MDDHPPAKPRAFSYLRFSTPEQAQGDSFRRQAALAVDYARRHGLDLDQTLTFEDLGMSAYRSRNAQKGALRIFLDAVEDGTIPEGSHLLVESLDRISRDQILSAQGLFLEIINAGVTLVTLSDQRVYSKDSINANPMDLIISLVAMMRANDESATKSRRLVAVWEAKRASASERPLTSVCPAWLQLDPKSRRFVPVEGRAEIVRRVYDEALAGRGQHAIAEALNRDGVATFGHRGRRGAFWHRSYIAKLLGNPATVGTLTPHRMEHRDGKKQRQSLDAIPGYFPAIITDDVYQRVQALRTAANSPQRGRHAARPVANVLGGLARCPACDGAMTLVSKGPRWRYLVCVAARAGAGCPYRSTRYAAVEDAIVRRSIEIVSDAPSGHDSEDALAYDLRGLDQQSDDLSNQLRNLLDVAADNPKAAPAALVARIAETERALSEANQKARTLRDRIDALMPHRLRTRLDAFLAAAATEPLDRGAVNAALRVLLTGVIVDPASGLLRFHWGHGGESSIVFTWPDC